MQDYGIHWKIVSYIMPIADIFVMGFCFCLLAKPFVKNKKRTPVIGAAYSLTMLVMYVMPLYVNEYVAYALGVLAAFLAILYADTSHTDTGNKSTLRMKNWEQKAFIAVTFYSLSRSASSAAEILYDNLYCFAENTYLISHPDMDFVLYFGMCTFYMLADCLIMFIAIRCILKVYVNKRENPGSKELLIQVIPAVMGVTGYAIMRYYRSFYIAGMGKNVIIYDGLQLLYCLISIASVVIVIALYQKITANHEEKVQNELLTVQVEAMKHHIEHVEKLYDDINTMRHDMTNHIITLKRLYDGNEYEEAKAYGEALNDGLSKISYEIKSGNPVTDVILQEIKNKAEERNIQFRQEFHYPVNTDINAFDVSIILNNALQNALENITENPKDGERPYISVLSYRRNNAFMIEIRNSFTGYIEWDWESGLPVSSKKEGTGHGIGLSNIRRTAKKYCGDISAAVSQKDGEFCLGIMLMTKTGQHK